MVWVLRDGRPQLIRIHVGITDGTNTEVLDGLAEGDAVITTSTGGSSPAESASPQRGGGNLRRMF